tara:strand:+ start:4422 stop:4787 length:366 start_codon:yes stop_codon:yes gene_type:complete
MMSRLSYVDISTLKSTMTYEREYLNNVQAVGCFRLPNVYNYFNLFSIEQWEKDSFLKDVIVKKNCKMFRYQTKTSKMGGYSPIIMVNMLSGLVYFNTGADEIAFETISEKPVFIVINSNEK